MSSTGIEEAAARELAPPGSGDAEEKPKRGRPKGSKTKKRAPARLVESEKPPKYQTSDATVAACATVGALVWNVAGPQFKCRPLTQDEALELGLALDAIAAKYLGDVFEKWAEEIALSLVVLGLYQRTRLPNLPAEPGADSPDGGRRPDSAPDASAIESPAPNYRGV